MRDAPRGGAGRRRSSGSTRRPRRSLRGGVDRGDSDAIFPGVELVNAPQHRRRLRPLRGRRRGRSRWSPAVALAALLVFFVLNRARRGAWVPTGLLLGGALGNVIDRVFRDDGVTDFIKLPAWPAFNIADMAITFGVLALVYVLEKPRAKA